MWTLFQEFLWEAFDFMFQEKSTKIWVFDIQYFISEIHFSK